MPAKITLAKPTSSVTSVKLRAGVVVVSPVVSESNQYPVAAISAEIPAAAVTHVYPVSNISYILLASSAYLDTTGLFKYTTDSVTVVEEAALDISKAADADSFYLQDTTTRSTTKAPSDTVAMSDSIVAVLVFIRDLTETIVLADEPAKLFTPAARVETVSATDTKTLAFSSAKADSLSVSDLAAIAYSTAYSDTISPSDAATILANKLFSETMSVSDSGVVVIQDYCDITYFAEDYVGAVQTF